MTDKIQEITQKIYNEGVIKAKDDASQILSDAKAKAEEIITSANNKKEIIITEANKQADELKKKTNAELQVAAQQFISKLKQKITETITCAQVEMPVKGAFEDINFVKEMILTIIKTWSQNKSEMDLKLLLPEKNKKNFIAFFDSKAMETISKGVEIKFDSKIGNGFKIGPVDESYILSFTDQDFENYLKVYIRDRTKKLLFASVEQE